MRGINQGPTHTATLHRTAFKKLKLQNYFYDQFYSITTRYVSGKTDQDHFHVQHRTEHMKVTTKGRSVRITSPMFFRLGR